MSNFKPKLGDRVVAISRRWRDKPLAPRFSMDDEPEREMYEERIPGRIELRYVFVSDDGIAMVPEAFERFEPPY